MFTKTQVSQSVIDSVSKILKEDDCVTPMQSKKIADKEVEKHEKHMHKGKKPTFEEKKTKEMDEDKLKETGFHMAAHAAKKAGQPHFTFQGKKYPTTAKSTAESMDEASTFDWKANKDEKDPKFTIKKPGERTGHDSKKTATGTVYTKKPVKHDDKEMKEEKSFDELLEDLNDAQVDKLIFEVLGKDADAGDYIHDFIHSKNPKFAGKSKEMRKKMALGAYYSKKNEEFDLYEETMKDCYDCGVKEAKKEMKTGIPRKSKYEKGTAEYKESLRGYNSVMKNEEVEIQEAADSHGSSRRQALVPKKLQDILDKQKQKYGNPNEYEKYSSKKDYSGRVKSTKEEVEIDEGMMDTVKKVGGKVLKTLGHGSDADMRKDLQKKMGMPQTGEKPKKEAVDRGEATTDTLAGRVKGGKDNEHSSIKVKLKAEATEKPPFDPPYRTVKSKDHNVKDKSGAVHTPMSQAKHLAKMAMKKVKTEMLGKTGTSE